MTEAEFIAAILCNPNNRVILSRLASLGLDDCWLVSGALFQTVWNVRCGLAPDHGIKDYDIFYFDPDTSYEAEDAAIARASQTFADFAVAVELRNQARVHLWYEKKFGAPYAPLARATDGIDRFLSRNAQVGIRPTGTAFEIYAPAGFSDIESMTVRPNRTANFQPAQYDAKAARWKSQWPGLIILPADGMRAQRA